MDSDPSPIDELLELAQSDPNRALHQVETELESTADSDPTRRVLLLNVRARALHALGLLDLAEAAASETLDAARAAMLRRGEAAQTLGLIAMHRGRGREAIATIDPLTSMLSGSEKADVHIALAMLHGSLDETDLAYGHYEQASRGLNPRLHMRQIFFLLNNRSVLNLDTGRFDEAIVDLRQAAALAASDGDRLLQAIAEHNQGVAQARLGHLGAAIKLFDEAVQTFEHLNAGFASANAYLDRAELLLDAGLVDEARDSATAAAALFERAGAPADLLRARGVLVRVELHAGEWDRAAALIAEAGEQHEDTAAVQPDAEDLSAVVHELSGTTHARPILAPGQLGVGASIEYGLHLLAVGDIDIAKAHLEVAVSSGQRDLSALAKLNRSVAMAYLASIGADTAIASRRVDEGLHIAQSNFAALGATALRSAAQRRVDQLVALSLAQAYRAGDLRRCVATVEAARSVSLHPEPPASEEDRALLAILRHATATLRTIDESSPQYLPLLRRRVEAEADLRSRRRHSTNASTDIPGSTFRHESVAVTLESTVLYLLDIAGSCIAIVGECDMLVAHELGRSADIASMAEALSRALGQAAEHRAGDPATDPWNNVEVRLRQPLREALMPVLDTGGSGQIVIIPDAAFHALPWALLTERPTAMAASYTLYEVARRASQGGSGDQRTLVVTGPGMLTNDGDVVSGVIPNAVSVAGADATASAVIAGFRSFDTVHIAAHGHFRADSPLFSEVELHDGPLTFFEMSGGAIAPRRVIFASCDVGKGIVSSPLSVASIFHQRGCRGVIASAGRVGDVTTNELFGQMHQRLANGVALPRALRESQETLMARDPSVALFRCYGPG